MQTPTIEARRTVGTPEAAPSSAPGTPASYAPDSPAAHPTFRRRKYWIDSSSQLPVTVLAFVVVSFFVVMFNVVMMDLAEARREFIVDAVPSMRAKLEAQDRDLQRLLTVSSTLLVACVMAGVVALTHRSAGPVVNVQNHMKRVANGDLGGVVTLRRRDHFKSLAEDFNLMMRALRKRAQEDVSTIERLAHRARTTNDHERVAAELEELAQAKRAALPN